MAPFKYFICLTMVALLSTFACLGCETERYTTKIGLTPVMEDGLTSTDRLSNELSDEMAIEDTKRIKMLQDEEAKRKEYEKKEYESRPTFEKQ